MDTNVRFRTTYYFRVFDMCWFANALVAGKHYQDIIPQTDTLYRYRMTGKASALGNQIHFESGTIDATDIDPFGTHLVYNEDIGGYYTRSKSDARKAMQAAADARDATASKLVAETERAGLLDRLKKLNDLLTTIGTDASGKSLTPRAETVEAIKAGMQSLMQIYAGTANAQLPVELGSKLTEINASIKMLSDGLADHDAASSKSLEAAIAKTVAASKDEIKTILDEEIAKLKAPAADSASSFCPEEAVHKKGFQIMGPEGMHDYDQDKRLILAMHSSAKPLTQTLQEYSGRLLAAKASPSDRLLPLARETLRIVETQRRLDQIAPRTEAGSKHPLGADDVFNEAVSAFHTPGGAQ